jgi:hypothetical protein
MRLRCSEPSCNRVILSQSRSYLYRRRQFCGNDCVDTYKARELRIHGGYVATDDNPGRNPSDWTFSAIALDP